MTDEVRIDDESLARDARAWLQRLVSGDATRAELEEARRWRQRSAAHEAAFAQAVHLWERLGPAGRSFAKRHNLKLRFSRTRGAGAGIGRRAMLSAAGAASAAAAVYVAIRPPLGLWPSFAELRADYRTGFGQQRRIVVADGVSVDMNTATSLNVHPMASNAVQIELLAGETAIATSAATQGAVVVIAGDGQTSTSNAHFNVRYDGPSVCVSCLDGEVQVQRQDATIALRALQQVTYSADTMGRPVAVDASEVFAWQQGLLIFRGTPLAEVIAEVNRYRAGRIVLVNTQLADQPINARLPVDRVDEIVPLMQRALGARIETLPGGFVLVS